MVGKLPFDDLDTNMTILKWCIHTQGVNYTGYENDPTVVFSDWDN